MKMSKESWFKYNKRMAIKAAKELLYPKEVIEKLEKATTEGQIQSILKSARDNL